jgi:caffeoyl-CoA O-methyltransferase
MRTTIVPEQVRGYLFEHCASIDDVHQHLIDRTREVGPAARMQIGRDQGTFFTLLTKLMRARNAIEIGTFTGYSALCIARGLPADGHLLTCDVNAEWAEIARDAWARAGLSDRVELRLGPALDTLRALPRTPAYDLAFVDADKPSYPDYYEELVPRIRVGGAMLIDNVLLASSVVSGDDEAARAMRAFNDHVNADGRVESVMLSIGDGVTLVRKISD